MVKAKTGAEKRFFQKLNRIITGRYTILVKPGIRASSDTKRNVSLPFSDFSSEFSEYPEYFKNVKTLNYHEVGHLMFTPYDMSEAFGRVRERLREICDNEFISLRNSATHFINMLEDCRVEMQFSSAYPNSKKYFTAFLLSIEKKSTEMFSSNQIGYFDTWGRKFLPTKYIADKRSKFIENNNLSKTEIQKMDNLIDEFVMTDGAEDWINALAKIIKYADEIIHDSSHPDAGISTKLSSVVSRKKGVNNGFTEGYKTSKMPKKDSRRIKKQVEDDIDRVKKSVEEMDEKKQNKEENKENYEQSDNADSDEEDAESTANKDEKDESKYKEGNSSSDDTNEEDDNSDTDKNNNADSEDANKSEEKEDTEDEDFDLDECIDENNEEIEKEIEDDIQIVRQGGGYSAYSKKSIGDTAPKNVTEDELKAGTAQLERVIKNMRIGLKEKYDTHQRTGKLDMRAAMHAQQSGNLRVFKKYRKNKERETRLAVVILIDRSGSMLGGKSRKAYSASWQIRKALEETDNKACEIAFNTGVRVIKDWNGRPNYWKTHPLGGTNPHNAIKVAGSKLETILQSDPSLNPMIIIITDGQYSPSVGVERTIRMIDRLTESKNGTKVAEIVLDYKMRHSERKEKMYDYVYSCEDIDKLPSVLETILKAVEQEFLDDRWGDIA